MWPLCIDPRGIWGGWGVEGEIVSRRSNVFLDVESNVWFGAFHDSLHHSPNIECKKGMTVMPESRVHALFVFRSREQKHFGLEISSIGFMCMDTNCPFESQEFF